MCYSLHVAVKVCINCSFFTFITYTVHNLQFAVFTLYSSLVPSKSLKSWFDSIGRSIAPFWSKSFFLLLHSHPPFPPLWRTPPIATNYLFAINEQYRTSWMKRLLCLNEPLKQHLTNWMFPALLCIPLHTHKDMSTYSAWWSHSSTKSIPQLVLVLHIFHLLIF